MNKHRYIIAICEEDVVLPGTAKRMSALHYKVLQTRELKELYKYQTHSYQPRGVRKHLILRKTTSDEHSTTYRCDELNATVVLLKSSENVYDDPETGTLFSALETYRSLLMVDS